MTRVWNSLAMGSAQADWSHEYCFVCSFWGIARVHSTGTYKLRPFKFILKHYHSLNFDASTPHIELSRYRLAGYETHLCWYLPSNGPVKIVIDPSPREDTLKIFRPIRQISHSNRFKLSLVDEKGHSKLLIRCVPGRGALSDGWSSSKGFSLPSITWVVWHNG